MSEGRLPQTRGQGVKREGLSGPLPGVEPDDLIGHIEKFGDNFQTEAEIINARAEALEKAEEGRKLRDEAKARESRAMASLGTGSADGDTHTTNGGMAGNSPAITVNTVLGLVLGVIVLLNLTLSPQQSAAITTIVTSLFVIIPVVAGFIIRAINTRRAQ